MICTGFPPLARGPPILAATADGDKRPHAQAGAGGIGHDAPAGDAVPGRRSQVRHSCYAAFRQHDVRVRAIWCTMRRGNKRRGTTG